ncbi:MAG TPA: hypothetical protein VF260_12760 [Bacilli bacterium]
MFHRHARPFVRIAFAVAAIVAIAGAAFFSTKSAFAEEDTGNGHMLLIVSVPGLSFADLQPQALKAAPNLAKLANNGAIAAMNIRTPTKGLEDSYATFGAGKPAVSDSQIQAYMANIFPSGRQALQKYERYQGKLPRDAAVIFPEVAAIRHMNDALAYGAEPGLLGEMLRQAGVHTYVFGNADESDMPNTAVTDEQNALKEKRYAPLMLMDKSGLVEFGDIGGHAVRSDPTRPAHVRTDYNFLLKQLQAVQTPAAVLLELGDLSRLYAEKERYAPDVFAAEKNKIMREIDAFLGKLAGLVQKRPNFVELWILSPQVSADAQREKLLFGPLLHVRAGEYGLLTSATTRQPGIVANFDLAPTFLAAFQLTSGTNMQGGLIRRVPVPDGKDQLTELLTVVSSAQKVYKLRPQILYPMVIFEIVALLLGLVAVLLKWARMAAWMKFILLIVLLCPLWLVLTGYWVQAPPAIMLGLFFSGVIVSVLALYRLRLWRSLFIIGAVTALCLLVDGLAGATGMRHSVLGYDPMIGARYYGIGNDLMGVLIGAALLGVSSGLHLLTERNRSLAPGIKLFAMLVLVGIIVYLAMPTMGTNAGGAITACAAFGLFALRLYRENPEHAVSIRMLLLAIILLIAAALVVLFVLNGLLFRGGAQTSHIGRAMSALGAGNLQLIGNMIIRKLSMNWQLIGVSSWSKVLITSLFVMVMLFIRPRGIFRTWQNVHPIMMYGFFATSVGALVALAVNDSGIVAAATMIVYTAAPMLMIRLAELSASPGHHKL